MQKRIKQGFTPSASDMNKTMSEAVESELKRLEISGEKQGSSLAVANGTNEDELRLKITVDMEKPMIIGVRAIGYGEKNFLSFRLLAEEGKLFPHS